MTAEQRELMLDIARSALAIDPEDLAARVVVSAIASGDDQLAVWTLGAVPIFEAIKEARAKRAAEQDVDRTS